MRYRSLGRSGLMVSVVGIGCNAFGTRIDLDRVRGIVDAAFDLGVNFFDTADVYGLGASEELLGQALAGRRDEVVVATKFGMDMEGHNGPDRGARSSRRYVRRAVEASLRRLDTDHIDLYQLHQPDLVTPVEETLEAMNELVDEGKVRYLGCSNFAGVGGHAGGLDGTVEGAARLRQRPERVLPLQQDGRGRAGPGLRGSRGRTAALLPAGLRSADRQVHPRG